MQVKVYTKPKAKRTTGKSVTKLKPLYNFYEVAWRSIWEMYMIESAASFRSMRDWTKELGNSSLMQQWKRKIYSDEVLSPEHVEYLVAELRYFAKLHHANVDRGTVLSGVDMVWTTNISDYLPLVKCFRRDVVSECAHFPTYTQNRPFSIPLYNRLRVSKSDGYAVKSPINPSLYTLLFDRSPILNSPTTSPLGALNLPSFGNFPGSHAAWKQAVRELNQRMAGNSSFIPINEKYLDKIDPEDRHWLPTDIHVNGDGTINILSYINNLHPGKYADAYKSIATMISRCIPALEQVLTDLKNLRDLRVPYDLETSVQEDIPHPTEYCYSYSRDPESDYEEAEEMWEDGLTKTTPLPDGFKRPKRTYLPRSLRNTSLQVVVKMEDMFANPTSERGYDADWHGDGTASEQIIATAVYFYDVDDDSDISLRFREGISAIDIRSRIRRERVMHMFVPSYAGLSESHHEQIVGDVKIRQGQVVCYPNVYQHCISGLYPKDPSKPCHIKSLTLHFVDPSIRIVSTSVVPPQQKEWWASEVLQTPLMRRLPSLMHEKIIESVDMPMSLDQASAIGLDLDKRSFKVDNNFYNGRFYMSLDNDLDSNHVDFF